VVSFVVQLPLSQVQEQAKWTQTLLRDPQRVFTTKSLAVMTGGGPITAVVMFEPPPSPSPPPPPPSPSPPPPPLAAPSSVAVLGLPALAGIGGVVVLLLGCACCVCYRRRASSSTDSTQQALLFVSV